MLAVKYRPRLFTEVIGQSVIIQILQNQIEQGKVVSSYLFNGGSGTGKTTIARIFANTLDSEVVEIDAASNNGVDSIRQINDNVKYQPLNHKYKIFIIDECHMLSTGAWNALLKTLEEPPSYVIFILCTTDPQKIPETIISRVQRYNFQQPSQEEIKNNLVDIYTKEGYELEEYSMEALNYISKLCNGGVRLSISMLETCLHSGQLLSVDVVNSVLGRVDTLNYITMLQRIVDKDYSNLIDELEITKEQGMNFKQYIQEYLVFIVDLKRYIITRDLSTCLVSETYLEDIKGLLNNIVDMYGGDINKLNTLLNTIYSSLQQLLRDSQYLNNPYYILLGNMLKIGEEL